MKSLWREIMKPVDDDPFGYGSAWDRMPPFLRVAVLVGAFLWFVPPMVGVFLMMVSMAL